MHSYIDMYVYLYTYLCKYTYTWSPPREGPLSQTPVRSDTIYSFMYLYIYMYAYAYLLGKVLFYRFQCVATLCMHLCI